MYVKNVKDVREHELKGEGVLKVRVKYLLHKGVGAKRLQLRLFTIDVGGHTPLEKHAHEHEVFMLTGKAFIRGGNAETVIGPGDVIFIPSYETHQIRNMGDEQVQFLCTKETMNSFKVEKTNNIYENEWMHGFKQTMIRLHERKQVDGR